MGIHIVKFSLPLNPIFFFANAILSFYTLLKKFPFCYYTFFSLPFSTQIRKPTKNTNPIHHITNV